MSKAKDPWRFVDKLRSDGNRVLVWAAKGAGGSMLNFRCTAPEDVLMPLVALIGEDEAKGPGKGDRDALLASLQAALA